MRVTAARAWSFADESIASSSRDVFMPDGCSLQLLETMRIRRPTGRSCFVAGADQPDDLSEALARGADGFVARPPPAPSSSCADEGARPAGPSERDSVSRLLAPTLTSALAKRSRPAKRAIRGHAERLTRARDAPRG